MAAWSVAASKMTTSSAPVFEKSARESSGSASTAPRARSTEQGVIVGVELGLAVVGITVGAGTGTLVGLPGCGDGAGVGRGVGLADGLDVGCGLVGCEEGAAVGLGVGFDDGYAEAVVGSEVDGFGLGAIDGGADGALDGVDVGDGAGRAPTFARDFIFRKG